MKSKTSARKHSPEPWYVRAFENDYLSRYAHRSDEIAVTEIAFVRKQLKLRAGVVILDLCCGAGRHSRALAAAGYNVIGIDLSADLLRSARATRSGKSSGRGRIRYIRADMRRLPLADCSVDGGVNMFTSFGYFSSDRDNARVLDEAARVLKPGAPFVMDYFNLKTTLASLVSLSVRNAGQLTLREKRWFDPRQRRLIKTVETTNGKKSGILRESLRAYAPSELKKLFKRAGFKIEKMFGDLSGAVFDEAKSPRCVIVARTAEHKK